MQVILSIAEVLHDKNGLSLGSWYYIIVICHKSLLISYSALGAVLWRWSHRHWDSLSPLCLFVFTFQLCLFVLLLIYELYSSPIIIEVHDCIHPECSLQESDAVVSELHRNLLILEATVSNAFDHIYFYHDVLKRSFIIYHTCNVGIATWIAYIFLFVAVRPRLRSFVRKSLSHNVSWLSWRDRQVYF